MKAKIPRIGIRYLKIDDLGFGPMLVGLAATELVEKEGGGGDLGGWPPSSAGISSGFDGKTACGVFLSSFFSLSSEAAGGGIIVFSSICPGNSLAGGGGGERGEEADGGTEEFPSGGVVSLAGSAGV